MARLWQRMQEMRLITLLAVLLLGAAVLSLLLVRSTNASSRGSMRGTGLSSTGAMPAGQVLVSNSQQQAPQPLILILSPMKNAVKHLPNFFRNLQQLSYPHDAISIGILESDSDDENLKEPVMFEGKQFNRTWDL